VVVDRVLSSQLADVKGMTAYMDQKKKIKDEFAQRPVQDPFRCLVPQCVARGLASSCRFVRSNPNLNPNFHPNPTSTPTSSPTPAATVTAHWAIRTGPRLAPSSTPR
jgi:hypothetical protein